MPQTQFCWLAFTNILKLISLKVLISVLSGILFSFTLAAGTSFTDTSYHKAAYTSKGTKAPVYNSKVAVVYPALLSSHREQTLDYIEKFATNRRAYLLRTFARGKKYFPKITTIFKKYNLPQELKVLIALESGFNGNAVSSAGAVGYWQIMDPVAKEYGLKIVENNLPPSKKTKDVEVKVKDPKKAPVDERKNLSKSTYAAAKYLRDRCRNLNNDYLLIVASYNWGVGNVWNAMQRTGKSKPTFWDIKKYLPAETRAYVMNFIALNVIFHNYDGFVKNKLSFDDLPEGDLRASNSSQKVDLLSR